MLWTSALVKVDEEGDSLERALADCCGQVRAGLAEQKPDLAIGFVSPHFVLEYERVPKLVKKALGARAFIGCSAGGLIGGGQEVERQPAVSITAAVLPGVDTSPFHCDDDDLPDPDDPPDTWEKLVKVKQAEEPCFILLPDPFSIRVDNLVQGLDFAFPKAIKVGGLASGANRPGLNALFLNDSTYHSGAVGLSLAGNVLVETVVAQGCRPIGYAMRVTRCKSNFLYELDGEPAVNVLHDLLVGMPKHDQELARNSLFLGVVMDEFKTDFKPGDFLIRNILGVEPNSGALVVGEVLRNERTVQFHLRDAATSADDLRLCLKHYCDAHGQRAAGALLFSCLGRGEHLYGRANHDSECFREYMGETPLGGFFCNGEIGPVGGTTFLHGYTSSFGIFCAKPGAKV